MVTWELDPPPPPPRVRLPWSFTRSKYRVIQTWRRLFQRCTLCGKSRHHGRKVLQGASSQRQRPDLCHWCNKYLTHAQNYGGAPRADR